MNAYSIGIIAEMRKTYHVERFTIARLSIDTWFSAIQRQVLHELDTAERLSKNVFALVYKI